MSRQMPVRHPTPRQKRPGQQRAARLPQPPIIPYLSPTRSSARTGGQGAGPVCIVFGAPSRCSGQRPYPGGEAHGLLHTSRDPAVDVRAGSGRARGLQPAGLDAGAGRACRARPCRRWSSGKIAGHRRRLPRLPHAQEDRAERPGSRSRQDARRAIRRARASPPHFKDAKGSPYSTHTNDHLTAWSGAWGVSFAANLTPGRDDRHRALERRARSSTPSRTASTWAPAGRSCRRCRGSGTTSCRTRISKAIYAYLKSLPADHEQGAGADRSGRQADVVARFAASGPRLTAQGSRAGQTARALSPSHAEAQPLPHHTPR